MSIQQILWGVTWGNNMAALEWWLAAGVAGFLLRHHIGRRLAAWWAAHYGPHAIAQHREALRQHEHARLAARQLRRPGDPL